MARHYYARATAQSSRRRMASAFTGHVLARLCTCSSLRRTSRVRSVHAIERSNCCARAAVVLSFCGSVTRLMLKGPKYSDPHRRHQGQRGAGAELAYRTPRALRSLPSELRTKHLFTDCASLRGRARGRGTYHSARSGLRRVRGPGPSSTRCYVGSARSLLSYELDEFRSLRADDAHLYGAILALSVCTPKQKIQSAIISYVRAFSTQLNRIISAASDRVSDRSALSFKYHARGVDRSTSYS